MASERIANIASLVVERYELTHPIDIMGFASRIATVKIDDLPEGLDGFIYYYPHPKPPYICVKGQYVPRLNFTLAHELGHFFIPWHPRVSRKCSPDDNVEAFLHLVQEAEANEFAGELLAPESWINSLFMSMPPEEIFELLIAADYLSFEAACINICKWEGLLAVRRVNADGGIDKTYKTKACLKSYPYATVPHDDACYTSSRPVGKNQFTFQVFEKPSKGLLPPSGRAGKAVLAEVLQELPADRAKTLAHSIQTVVAAVNSSMRNHPLEEFFPRCIERLRRDEYSILHQHPLFELYVSERCRELRSGGGKRR